MHKGCIITINPTKMRNNKPSPYTSRLNSLLGIAIIVGGAFAGFFSGAMYAFWECFKSYCPVYASSAPIWMPIAFFAVATLLFIKLKNNASVYTKRSLLIALTAVFALAAVPVIIISLESIIALQIALLLVLYISSALFVISKTKYLAKADQKNRDKEDIDAAWALPEKYRPVLAKLSVVASVLLIFAVLGWQAAKMFCATEECSPSTQVATGVLSVLVLASIASLIALLVGRVWSTYARRLAVAFMLLIFVFLIVLLTIQ